MPAIVPSDAMITDSMRTIRRTRRSSMPTTRNSPSSRRRSRIDSDIVLTMPISATMTLISSRPLTALMRKSKIPPIDAPIALPAVSEMSGRSDRTSLISSSTSDCAPDATSMNADDGCVTPMKESKVSAATKLPVNDVVDVGVDDPDHFELEAGRRLLLTIVTVDPSAGPSSVVDPPRAAPSLITMPPGSEIVERSLRRSRRRSTR